jgi:hypothetical protein
MDWQNKNLNDLDIKIINCDKPVINKSDWAKLKSQVLKKNGEICGYCGGRYKKYLYMCSITDKNYELDNCILGCKLCYMITHITPEVIKECVLLVSDLSQREIIRRTVDYYLKYNKMPEIKDIDAGVLDLDLSLVEYLALLSKTNFRLKNGRIFFTKYLNTVFLDTMASIISKDTIMFVDDENDIEDNEYYLNYKCEINDLPRYEFTKEELDQLNKHFNGIDDKDKKTKIKMYKDEIKYDNMINHEIKKKYIKIN